MGQNKCFRLHCASFFSLWHRKRNTCTCKCNYLRCMYISFALDLIANAKQRKRQVEYGLLFLIFLYMAVIFFPSDYIHAG